MNRSHTASPTGAQEALRLVQQFVPDASLEASQFGNSCWNADLPMYQVLLPSGERMNAGLILDAYYNRGQNEAGAAKTLSQELSHLTGGVNVMA